MPIFGEEKKEENTDTEKAEKKETSSAVEGSLDEEESKDTQTPSDPTVPKQDIMYESPADKKGMSAELTLYTRPQAPPPPSGSVRMMRTVFDYLRIILLTMFIVFLLTMFCFRHAVVDGESMENNLYDGEHLIISDLFYKPAYGDIVVFQDEETTLLDHPLIKRVIAVEGQTVTIRVDGVYVDGEKLNEPYANHTGGAYRHEIDYITSHLTLLPQYNLMQYAQEDENGLMCYTYTVGEGEIFLLGDNRYNSLDSRFFGPVDADTVYGRVLLRVAPFDRFGTV